MNTLTGAQLAQEILQLLREQDRFSLLPNLVEELEKELSRSQEITVVAAEELTPSQKTELEQTLSQKWGEHVFIYRIDPALLSGIIIRFQEKQIDLSGKKSLKDLAKQLTN